MTTANVAAGAAVLVVGDDADAASFLAAVLNRSGIRATATTTESAAATVAQTTPPFAVVAVDATIDAVRSIRALADPKRAATPVVMLGAPGAPAADATAAREAGATHWVDRPVDEATLVHGFRQMVDANPNGPS